MLSIFSSVSRMWWILVCLAIPLAGEAQYRLRISGDMKEDQREMRFTQAESAVKELQNLYLGVLSEGYLYARIDTFTRDSILYASLVRGERVQLALAELMADSSRASVITEYRKKRQPPFSLDQLQYHADVLLANFENRGYPFVSMTIQRIDIEGSKAGIHYTLNPGPLIRMDSLAIRSETKVPQRYVRNYLDFKTGDLYNEEKLNRIPSRLREIPFLTVRQKPELVFHPGEADVFLFLEKKKANFFNGILGVRPDDNTGKINITGDAEIKLLNAFNTGEEFYLNWRKMQALTQDLTVKTTIPYLFSSPIGLDGLLKIYKRDTTFTSTRTNIGLLFNFSGMNRLKVFAEKISSAQISSFVTAQPLANVNSTLYGLSLNLENLDYRYNPRKGFSVQLEAAAGKRQVQNNNLTTEGSGNIPNKQIYRYEMSSEYYIPTWKQQAIRLSAAGSAIIAPSLFDNEMYRIGGLRTLRGIDEESINTSSWFIGSIEYRLLFGENSAVYLFTDQAWYEKKSATEFVTDTPLGFGAGVNFETNAGIFTFNYAIGQQFDNPIQVRNAKVSFGFRNLF